MAARPEREQLQLVVDRYVAGELSAPVTVMHLLLATHDVRAAMAALSEVVAPDPRRSELAELLAEHLGGCTTITQMLGAGLDRDEPPASVEAGIAATRALFDDSVARSEVASVALYSLGSEDVLARATGELVQVLDDWRVLATDRDALEIGCGIGRLLAPLSPKLRSLLGLDISSGMIEAARRRSLGLANVTLALGDGRGLADVADASKDLVLAIDSFPYIVRSGRELCSAMFAEVRRVLRDGGDFVICNYSYVHGRSDAAAEVASLAAEVGLRVVRSDETPFRLWDATAYQLRRSP